MLPEISKIVDAIQRQNNGYTHPSMMCNAIHKWELGEIPDYLLRDISLYTSRITLDGDYFFLKPIDISDVNAVLLHVFRFYSKFGKYAKNFLQNRKININQYGFAPSGNILLKYVKSKQPDMLPILLDLGLIRIGEYGMYDFFRNRIILPVANKFGIFGITGRAISSKIMPKYLNCSFEKTANLALFRYKKDKLKESLFVGEGYFDAYMLRNIFRSNSCYCLGTSISDKQFIEILQYKEVTFCFDGDKAGSNALKKIIELIERLLNGCDDLFGGPLERTEFFLHKKFNTQFYYIQLPNEKDPFDLGNGLRSLKRHLICASDEEFITEYLFSNFNLMADLFKKMDKMDLTQIVTWIDAVKAAYIAVNNQNYYPFRKFYEKPEYNWLLTITLEDLAELGQNLKAQYEKICDNPIVVVI